MIVKAIGSIVIGALVAAFFLFREEHLPIWIGPALGAAIALVMFFLLARRDLARRRLARVPFPPPWRATLEEHVAFYGALSAEEKRRFEREVHVFIAEQTIGGPRGKDVEDELKVLVAASAVALVFGRPGYRYPRLRDIVVYDRSFDEDYAQGGDILGMVHAQGPILFSAQSLRRGFQADNDGQNVGYHEFAHVLDFESGSADGVPALMAWGAVRPWIALMHTETAKVKRRQSVLRQYAATNEAEFFAVATEMFFEQPAKMSAKHPELYALLRDTYGQDPVAKRARLVTEPKST